MANNLELSQFASYVEVNDLTQTILIGPSEGDDQFVGIGTTNPSSKLFVNGTITSNKDLIVNGITTTNGPVTVEGPLQILTDKKYIPGIGTIGQGADNIPAALSVGGDLLVIGQSFFESNTSFIGGGNTFYGTVDVYGQFITTSFTQLGAETQILGITTISNKLIIETPESPGFATDKNAALYVDGGIAVQQDVYIKELLDVRDLNVNESSFFYGDVGIQTNLRVTGNTILDNNFISNGISTFSNIVRITDDSGSSDSSTGALVVAGGVGIGQDLNILDKLNVNGTSTFNGNVSLLGNETNIGSNLISLGSTSTSDIFVIGSFDSDLLPKINDEYDLGTIGRRWNTIRSRSGVFDTVDISTELTSFGTIIFGGDFFVTNGMDVTGTTTFNSGLIASSTSFFNNVIISGTLTLDGETAAVGTISTATRAETVDVSEIATASDFYVGFFDSFSDEEGRTVYVDQGFKYNPGLDQVTIEGELVLNGNSIRTTNQNSSLDLFVDNVVSANFCTLAQSLLFGNNVGVTTFRSQLVDFGGDIRIAGNGTTSAIIAADSSINIVLGANEYTEFIGDIKINGTTLEVKNDTFFLADENVTTAYAFGETTAVYIGQSDVGFTSIRSPVTILEGNLRILGNSILSSSNTVNITLQDDVKTIFAGDIQVDTNNILANDTNVNITLDSNLNTIFAGDVRVGGNKIKASDGEVNIFMTSNTLTSIAGNLRVEGNEIEDASGVKNMTLGSNFVEFAGDIKILGNDIRSGDGPINITLDSNLNTIFAGDIQIGGDKIKASDETLSIELRPGTGSVVIPNNFITKGNLTAVKSNQLAIKDKLVNIGLIDDPLNQDNLIEPDSDQNKDVGIVLNYYDTQARKAAVYWDDSVSRITLASRVVEASEVLTASIYGDVELGSLWVNDCAGQSQIISCSDGIRTLGNIVVDGGIF
jgi:hypothetical protein